MSRIFNGIMIATDLDGTILGENMMSDSDKKAKDYFEANGGLFTIATGRSMSSALSVLNNIDIKVPAILLNGPLIKNIQTNEILNATYMPEETEDILKGLLNIFPTLAIEIYCKDKMYLINSNETSEDHIANEAIDYEYSNFDTVPNDWIKVVIIDKTEILFLLSQHFNDKELPFCKIWSEGSIFHELIHKDADKGASVLYLANHYGIKNSNIICLGDGPNDVGMIKNAGLGIAVSNASNAAKEVADKVIVSNNESPLTFIVKNIL